MKKKKKCEGIGKNGVNSISEEDLSTIETLSEGEISGSLPEYMKPAFSATKKEPTEQSTALFSGRRDRSPVEIYRTSTDGTLPIFGLNPMYSPCLLYTSPSPRD